MIHTQLHNIIEDFRIAGERGVARHGRTASYYDHFLKGHPHYVICDEAFDVLSSDGAVKTLESIAEAGLLHLPYETCIVEGNCEERKGTAGRAVLLCQDLQNQSFKVDGLFHIANAIYGLEQPCVIRVEGRGWVVDHAPDRSFAAYIVYMVGALILMTHTRGVAQTHVTADDLHRFNRAREKRGRTTVKPYTVLKIGTVYDRDGKAHTWHPGAKMRPHLRKGYMRNQRVGAGRTETKLLWVRPTFVNYVEGDPVPQPKPVLVRA